MLNKIIQAIARSLPGRKSARDGSDPLADKLTGLKLEEHEDEESVRRQSATAERGDALGNTVFRARPQNPLSDDF